LPTLTSSPLAAAFYQALQYYHRRSNVDGHLQLPPGVTEAQLDGFTHGVADFAASVPGMNLLQAPSDPAAREAFRDAIAARTRDDIGQNAAQHVAAAVHLIHNPGIQALVQKALNAAPPEFLTAPGCDPHHHPADEMNPGGLAQHTLRVTAMGAALCDKFNVQGEARDEIVAALVVHDIEKGGIPWNGYAKDHAPLGERFLERVWADEPDRARVDRIAHLVGMHKAQWNAPQPTPPTTLAEQIVSYADFLPNLDDVYFTPQT